MPEPAPRPAPEPAPAPAPAPALGSAPVVVVGTGVAGATAALTLRDRGYEGPLVLLGEEPELPYRRPPLSKEVLTGGQPPDRTLLKPAGHWADRGIELRTGVAATALHPGEWGVTLDDGTRLPYARLLLATGCRARALPAAVAAPGTPGVHLLRSLADARALRAALLESTSVLVVGAGLVGLEVAASARESGLAVTVLESAERPLGRVLPTVVAGALAALHRARGVDLRTGTTLERLVPAGPGGGVRAHLGDGTVLAADLAVVAVGAVPETGLAARAGLAVDDGIVVDAYAATSAPGVYAAGDVARRPVPLLGGSRRVEHWTGAQEHGAAAARALLGEGEPYTAVPWFWTHQYGVNLQVSGDPQTARSLTVDGEPAALDFAALAHGPDRVVGAVCAGRPADFRRLRALVGHGPPPPAPADPVPPPVALDGRA